MRNSDSRRADNCFDFLRLFAACCVVVQHTAENLHVPFLWVTPDSPYWFYSGVPLFLILSGMMVYQSCENCVERGRPIWQFYMNRYLRVAPAVYVYAVATGALLVSIGALSLTSARFWAWLGSNLILAPIYHPALSVPFGSPNINGSLWTISVEVSFYVSVPLFYFFEKRFGFRALMILLGIGSATGMGIAWAYQLHLVASTLVSRLALGVNVSFVSQLLYFTLGIFWGKAWQRTRQSGYLATLCFLIYAGISVATFRGRNWGPLGVIAWSLPLSYAVVWFGFNGPKVLTKVTRIGDLSFGIYVWHMVVVNTFKYFNVPAMFDGVPNVVLPLVVFGASFILALSSWWLVEKPALGLKPFTSRVHRPAEARAEADA